MDITVTLESENAEGILIRRTLDTNYPRKTDANSLADRQGEVSVRLDGDSMQADQDLTEADEDEIRRRLETILYRELRLGT